MSLKMGCWMEKLLKDKMEYLIIYINGLIDGTENNSIKKNFGYILNYIKYAIQPEDSKIESISSEIYNRAYRKYKEEFHDELTQENSIQNLDIPQRIKNCLHDEDIHTINQLLNQRWIFIRSMPKMGRKSCMQLNDFLNYKGLSLKDEYAR